MEFPQLARAMGAAQSKKGRKERKRKRKMPGGQSSDFSTSRSASMDFVDTSHDCTTPCLLCRQLSERRTFYDSLDSYHGNRYHSRHLGHHAEGSNIVDGYESCPSCSNSTYCLSSFPSRPDTERSTMSLNRNLVGRSLNLTQTKCSELTELLDILKSHEYHGGETLLPKSTTKRRYRQTLTGLNATEKTASNAEIPTAKTSPTHSHTVPPENHKKSISILEDEVSRLARWERQKLMAQQLRNLRKHIQQREVSTTSETSAGPFPDMNLAEIVEKSGIGDEHPVVGTDNDEVVSHAGISDSGSKESCNASQSSLQSRFSKLSNYRFLDNHPALSKLQNEQNNRLESMERRMREIRISAMQEAERRKFAEIFPAKEDNAETEKMLQEARETLEKIKAEKKRRSEEQQTHLIGTGQSPGTFSNSIYSNTHDQDSRISEDSGDIIPVHIIPKQRVRYCCKEDSTAQPKAEPTLSQDKTVKSREQNRKSDWLNEAWPNINLGNPFTWLLLPFLMFPLILRMLLSLIITTTNTGSNSGGSSASISNAGSTLSAVPYNGNRADTRYKKP